MSIALVQSTSGQGSSSSSIATLAFNSDNTAGNMIVVFIVNNSPSAGAFIAGFPSDSNGNTYTFVTFDQGWGTGGQNAVSLWYAYGIAAGPNTVTFNFDGDGTYAGVIAEYSNTTTINTVDNVNSGDGNSSTADPGAINSFATEALYIAAAGGNQSNGITFTTPSGWTADQSSTTVTAFNYCYLVGTGNQHATFALGGSDNWGAITAVFKSVSASVNIFVPWLDNDLPM